MISRVLWFHQKDVFSRLSQWLKWIVNVWSVRMSKKKWMSNSLWWAQNKYRTIGVSAPKSIHIHIIYVFNSFLMFNYRPRMTFFFRTCQHRLKSLIYLFRVILNTNFWEYIFGELITFIWTIALWNSGLIGNVESIVSKLRFWFNGCCGFMKYICLVDSTNL